MRIGLLGTGPWANNTHAPALSAHPDVEFTGVWGRRPEAATALAERFDTRAYDDADALIKASDAVAVALPPAVQAGLAVRAAEAGRHLLLDKPVAVTVQDARRVADAAAASGVASVVFFTVRFGAATRPWIAEQAAAGGWFTARAEWLASVFAGGDSPYADSPWRREKGALWDVGPHALSVLLPVLGDTVAVSASRGPGDTVHLVLRHASGASSTATLSLTTPRPAAGVAVELRGANGVTALPQRAEGDSAVSALGRALDALIAASRTGEPHSCDVRFGARVVEILAEAERQVSNT